ncbi:MAG: calcium-translocating P-type ATPase, PMCA-type [Oscillospiraceae bacterium]|nr:calcium-translocating P-type ATPase, PMCA-type [Oscillospiraceae bacterium]
MDKSREKKFGLTSDQVQKSLNEHGSNRLSEVQGETFFDKLMGNFGDPMIKILCVALGVNLLIFILGATNILPNVDVEWYEPVGIAIAIALATFVSTFSEFRNENAFQKLQEEASKITCKIYRDGVIKEIPIDDIVVGDCVLLQSGDKIPADGQIVDGDIKVDQSVLNGESKEASKVPVPENYSDEGEAMDFLNPYKVFRGSVVCSGNAVMEVTVVGDKSVYGQIAKELQQDDDRESPLKVKLSNLADGISKFGYIGGIAIAVALLFQRIMTGGGFGVYFSSGFANILADVLDAVILAVIIIVMAVPEGLPLMIALVSAMNMGKMLKDNVLVRKINGIETAGSLNILFSDKTGTITKGKLEVVTFVDGNMTEVSKASEVKGKLSEILAVSVHHNTTSIVSREDGQVKVVGGNATEKAVLGFVADLVPDGVSVEKVSSIPFNSTNKYSATQVKGDYNCTLVKGAPEKIISRCKYYFDEEGNKQEFTNGQAIEDKINELAGRAIRVLGLAIADEALGEDSLPEGNWTLIGILGIRDEVRPESVTAIAEVHQAGVQVVMITGDRKDTAVAIAKEANLLTSDTDVVLTSDELQKMSDDEIKKVLPNIRVIARALPTDKSRLVRIAQEMELVVGMTGDGVNDSPALKKADVGFAMGGGTEVAKEASDIVILDDNFNSIDKAILYGRTIFNSIRKFIVFQLTINVAAVLISFVCPLLGINEPLTVIQILWVNLVMDTLAALAFGGEPALKRFMKEKPKKRSESIVSKKMWSSIITGSLWMFILGFFMLTFSPLQKIFVEGLEGVNTFNPADFSSGDKYLELGTAYFAFFIFSAVFNAFNARTDKANLFENIGGNKGFLKVLGIIAVVQIAMTYLGGAVLRCHGLDFVEWLVVLVMAVSIIPVDLIRKAVMKNK